MLGCYWNASVSRAHKGLFSLLGNPTFDLAFGSVRWQKHHLPAIDCVTEQSDASLIAVLSENGPRNAGHIINFMYAWQTNEISTFSPWEWIYELWQTMAVFIQTAFASTQRQLQDGKRATWKLTLVVYLPIWTVEPESMKLTASFECICFATHFELENSSTSSVDIPHTVPVWGERSQIKQPQRKHTKKLWWWIKEERKIYCIIIATIL